MKPVSWYCGPVAIASVLGITRRDAARRLLKYEPQRRGWFCWSSLANVLGPRSKHVLDYKDVSPRPTLARWLREDGRDAIVMVSSHFVHVRGGAVVEDNGKPCRRGWVRIVILLDGRKKS